MKTERILEIVAAHLADEYGEAWVHAAGTRAMGQLRAPGHHVSIGGWYPDLLALRDGDLVVAGVACGDDSDYLAGLGRALIFRKGAHYSFLAGELAKTRQYRDVALDSGLGIISVSPDERIDLQLPSASNLPLENDVRRELDILARRNVRRRFASLAFNHPVHFVAPIMAIRPDTPQTKQEVASLLMERWGFSGSRTEAWWSCFYGALFLGLIRESATEEETLNLSELGVQVRNALLERHSAAELRELVNKRVPLLDHAPDVALVLRGLYLAEPDVALMVRILRTLEPTGVGVEKLILRTLQLYPNAAVNLFFRAEEHDKVLELLRGARYRELFEPEYARQAILPGVYGPFKRQMIHLGFLRSDCPTWSEAEKYDPGEDLWIPRG
jgi:hypothetical protein